MSKDKVAHHEELPHDDSLPVPPVGDSTPDDARKGLSSAAEHAGAHAVADTPAAAAKEEIQDDKLRPFFRFSEGRAWARSDAQADWTEVDPANARVAAASLGNVDDSARASAAAACVRAYRLSK